MMMRTTPANLIPAPVLYLLAPALALAQEAGAHREAEGPVTSSPRFWYWVVVLAVAVALFVWRAVVISRRRGGPPTTPRTL
jgi:anti-sigma-K factor RskA